MHRTLNQQTPSPAPSPLLCSNSAHGLMPVFRFGAGNVRFVAAAAIGTVSNNNIAAQHSMRCAALHCRQVRGSMEYSEYSQVQPVEISSKEWQFVRIAHLANPLGLPVHLGVYAAAPSKQVGRGRTVPQ